MYYRQLAGNRKTLEMSNFYYHYFFCFFLRALTPNNEDGRFSEKAFFPSWFDFSISQIQTRDGWVRSKNATAVLCLKAETQLMQEPNQLDLWIYLPE